MADALPYDKPAAAEPVAVLWAEPAWEAFHVAPDRKAGRRPGLACRWTRDRADRRLVGVWTRRRPDIVVG
jgi:hypothetical protein